MYFIKATNGHILLPTTRNGGADTTVNTCYNQQNANGFAQVYGSTQQAGTNVISDGINHNASETLWSNNRIAMLWFDNLDHSWSGGVSASGDYIADDSINFANYLGMFFTNNNQRVNRNNAPSITTHNAITTNNQLTITGSAIDSDGQVTQINLNIESLNSGSTVLVETLNTQVTINDSYSVTSSILNDGLYKVTAIAIDNENKTSDEVSLIIRIGPEPLASSPTLNAIEVNVLGQCATITGTVFDDNQNLSTVDISFANGNVIATLNAQHFSAEKCGIPGGINTATVTATDSTNLSHSETITFTVDAGITGDYNLHINQGHISWGNGFSACYLAFGTNQFTMRIPYQW